MAEVMAESRWAVHTLAAGVWFAERFSFTISCPYSHLLHTEYALTSYVLRTAYGVLLHGRPSGHEMRHRLQRATSPAYLPQMTARGVWGACKEVAAASRDGYLRSSAPAWELSDPPILIRSWANWQ